MRRFLAVTSTVVSLLGAGLIASGTADASALPKIQSDGWSGNWHQSWKVRPRTIVFGSYYFIKDLRYGHYNRHSAWATGRLFIDNCQPDCAQSGHFVAATADFWDVFDHKGPGLNFGYLSLKWDGGRRSRLMWIDSLGEYWWKALGTPPADRTRVADQQPRHLPGPRADAEVTPRPNAPGAA